MGKIHANSDDSLSGPDGIWGLSDSESEAPPPPRASSPTSFSFAPPRSPVAELRRRSSRLTRRAVSPKTFLLLPPKDLLEAFTTSKKDSKAVKVKKTSTSSATSSKKKSNVEKSTKNTPTSSEGSKSANATKKASTSSATSSKKSRTSKAASKKSRTVKKRLRKSKSSENVKRTSQKRKTAGRFAREYVGASESAKAAGDDVNNEHELFFPFEAPVALAEALNDIKTEPEDGHYEDFVDREIKLEPVWDEPEEKAEVRDFVEVKEEPLWGVEEAQQQAYHEENAPEVMLINSHIVGAQLHGVVVSHSFIAGSNIYGGIIFGALMNQ